MEGYPPGTKCVITWDGFKRSKASGLKIGDVVVTDDYVKTVADHQGPLYNSSLWPTELMQGVGPKYAWLVKYMRPLTDPDPEPIEQSKELAV